MRRSMTTLGVGLVALLMILGPAPARAGEMSWEDAAGEPSTFAQGTWDITKVTLAFDGATFSVRLKLAALGDPAPFGTGQHFTASFMHGENEMILRLTQDRVSGETFVFQQPSGQNQVTTVPCKSCKYKLDREKSEVLMQIGFESLKGASRKLGPGQSVDQITVFTGATYSEPSGEFNTLLWGGSYPGDTAPPPDGEGFTF